MSTLKVNSIIPVAGVPTGGGGGIVQVKQTVKSDTTTVASSSFADLPGMTITITPTSSSSKIFIMSHMTFCHQDQNHTVVFRLMRGSTDVCIGDADGSRLQALKLQRKVLNLYLMQLTKVQKKETAKQTN